MDRPITRRVWLSSLVAAVVAGSRAVRADVRGAETAGKRSRIIAACTRRWPFNQGDCSAFVRAVAGDCGVVLSGNANAIYEQIASGPWVRIGVGASAASVAGVTAGEGRLVIAARQDQPHGHVAVVVDYRNAFDSYSAIDRRKAVAFWGSLNFVGAEYTRITKSWSSADLQGVLFAYRELA
jgi:hypothetical protein